MEGEGFTSSDLYAPTLKPPEARLLAAIAAEHGHLKISQVTTIATMTTILSLYNNNKQYKKQ